MSNAFSALQAIREIAPDLGLHSVEISDGVLAADFRMPGYDGVQFIRIDGVTVEAAAQMVVNGVRDALK